MIIINLIISEISGQLAVAFSGEQKNVSNTELELALKIKNQLSQTITESMPKNTIFNSFERDLKSDAPSS